MAVPAIPVFSSAPAVAAKIGAPREAREHRGDVRENPGVVRIGAQEAERLVEPLHGARAAQGTPREDREARPLPGGGVAARGGPQALERDKGLARFHRALLRERTPGEDRGGLGIRPGQLRLQEQQPSPSRGGRAGRGALELVGEEAAIELQRREAGLGRAPLEEREPHERRGVRLRKGERLGEPLAELAPAGGGQPVLAPRRALRGAPPPERHEAAAQEAAERGVDLRELRVPAERGIPGEPRPEVPSARRTAPEKPEKDVRKGHDREYIRIYIQRWIRTWNEPVEILFAEAARGRARTKK